MLTAPAACAGVVAVRLVALDTTTFVAAIPANVTDAPATKSVPVSVTTMPPTSGPAFGLIPVSVGGATAVIDVGDTTLKLVAAAVPNVTARALVKSVPVIVTVVPPVAGPVVGVMLVTFGGGASAPRA